ncbi:MAG: choice-of-anchor I family protein [Thiotrichales bacterium]
MKLKSLALALAAAGLVSLIACSSSSSPTASSSSTIPVGGKPLQAFNFELGSVTFSNGFKLEATWGMGSAAAHRDGDDNKSFYTMTDRGVNIKCKDDEEIIGIDICDSGKIFPFPTFTPTIFKFSLSGDSAVVKEVITIKDKDGNPISGVSNQLSNFTEKAYDIDGNEMAYDPNGLDTEALAVLKDGSFWISEEYAPSLVHADADGKIIERLVPAGLESELSGANYTVKGDLPAIIAKRHPNRGIESIAVSPDEQYLYFAIQSPLDNPDYGDTRNLRMYKMAIADHSDIKEYLYQIDLPDTYNKDNESKTRKQKDVKVSEMTALEDGTILVLERISKTTKLYRVDFDAATPVPADKSDNLETDDSGVTPIAKKKVFDTDLRDGFPSKVEGIAPLGNGQFLTINDNDFGIEGDDTVIKIADIDVNASPDKKQTKGRVLFFDTDGNFEKAVAVGILPDMVTYTHNGNKVLVANEGELVGNEDLEAPLYDPYGTVSIIDTATYDVTTVDFKSVTSAPVGSKIRKGAEIARDFEPEYIAVSEDDATAWVTLQESNAVAKINLLNDTLDTVFGLGFKDLSKSENAMDYKKDGVIDIAMLPAGVYGMYQPDTIAAYNVDGKNYFVIANEGDDRDDFYAETTKASKLTHSAIPDIGDLRVCPDIGDEDGDGSYEKLFAYGARSFAIFDGETGELVFESGKEMAETVAARVPDYFNTRPKKGKWYPLDERSEKKGIEPEALALGSVNGKTYAYVGLEKQGGFFVYDITDPQNSSMVDYFNDIDYTRTFDYENDPVPADIDDMAPEGSTIFTQDGTNYYVNANEVSGTVSVFEIAVDGKVTKKGTFHSGIYYKSATEIVEYDPATKRLFVTSAANNGIYMLDVSDVTDIKQIKLIDLAPYGDGVNSVSVNGGKIAVAVERYE